MSPRATLLLKTSRLESRYGLEREVTIGRDPACDIVVHSDRVAPQHARVYLDEKTQRFFVESLTASETTAINGDPIRSPQRLTTMNVITLGGTVDLVFQLASASAPPSSEAALAEPHAEPPRGLPPRTETPRSAPPQETPPTIDPTVTEPDGFTPAGFVVPGAAPVKVDGTEPDGFRPIAFAPRPPQLGSASTPPAEPEAEKPVGIDPAVTQREPFVMGEWPGQETRRAAPKALSLKIESPSEVAGIHDLSDGETMIGSSPVCGIRITHWTVSRKHALLTVANGVCRLKDLGSTHGTYLRERRLTAEEELPLGAPVKIGQVVAVLTTRPR